MSNNRPQNHRGIIPANQARGTIYTYQMMPQHIPGMFSQGAMNRMPVPQPMFYYNQQPQMTEEQMKMQLKEHNYHIQQQRLRSFNASTSQKRVNPDDFIQSMFGKPSNVRNNPVASSPKPDPEPISTSVAPKIPEIVQVQEIPTVNNQKNLEDMLLECTDLMRPGKAHSFPKLKENKRKSSTEVNLELKNGFPNWCYNETNLPDLYKRVERTVTVETTIDTSLLYPILVSSGLNHEVLGHIWALCNQTTPGQLVQHELYSALTLVALAQNGYKFTGLDILQSLTRPLVPYLKEKQPETAKIEENQEEFTDFLGFAPTVQPSVGSSTVGNRLAYYNVGSSPPAKEKRENDDKYDIFRELDQERRSSESTDDEFGDFVTGNEPKAEEIVEKMPKMEKIVEKLPKMEKIVQEAAEIVEQNVKFDEMKPVDEKSVDSLIQSSLNQFEMITKSMPDYEFGDFVSPDVNLSNFNVENRSVCSLDLGPVDDTSLHSLELKTTFHDDDPYRFVNSNNQSDKERNVQEWEKCLDSCYELINGANCILNDISSESVCEEVINSDEGINYLKNIIEIYLLTTRLQHSIKLSGATNETLNKLLANINTAWTHLSSIISKSNLTPRKEDFDEIKPEQNTCGVCLLGINEIRHLEFSGRQYHAGCANFWVNCVNSMLPALTFQLSY